MGGGSRYVTMVRLLVLASVGFLTVTNGLVTVGLLHDIAHDFGVSESVAGLMTALYAGVIVVTIVPLMSVTRRAPRRLLLAVALLVSILGNLLIAASPWFVVALGGRLLGGIAQGMVWALLAPFASRLVEPARLGRALAVVFTGNTLGLAVGAPLGGLLGGLVGWRAVFVILSATAAVMVVLVSTVLPHIQSPSQEFSIRDALRRPGMPGIAAVGALLLLANFSSLTYLAPLVRERDLGQPLDAIALSMFGCAGLIGVLVAGANSDMRPRGAMLASMGVWILALGTLLLVPSGEILTLGVVVVWGACTAACSVLNQSAMLRVAGSQKDAATTVLVVVTQGGVALGAVYGGLAIDALGLRLLPGATAVPLLIALVLVLIRRDAYPPRPRLPT